jgi:hypothetical protein
MTRSISKPTPKAFAMMEAMKHAPFSATTDDAAVAPRTRIKRDEDAAKTVTKTVSTRKDTKLAAAHLPESTHRGLRIVAAEEGLTMQQILEEAVHDWLVKKGAMKLINK